jgi:hypothetical protein
MRSRSRWNRLREVASRLGVLSAARLRFLRSVGSKISTHH